MCFPITGGSIISLPFSKTFSLRVFMQESHRMSGRPIVKCRHFCVHGYHFLGDSTGCDVGRVGGLVLRRQIMPSLVTGVLLLPTNI